MRAYLKHPFWQAALLLVLAYIVIAFYSFFGSRPRVLAAGAVA